MAKKRAKGMVAATMSALRRLPRKSHCTRKISTTPEDHVVQDGVGRDRDEFAAVVDLLERTPGGRIPPALILSTSASTRRMRRQALLAAAHQDDALHDVVVVVLAGDAQARLDGRPRPSRRP